MDKANKIAGEIRGKLKGILSSQTLRNIHRNGWSE